MTLEATLVTRKNTIPEEKKWKILEEYLNCKLSIQDIADKYEVSYKSVESFISTLYKKFQNVRETKVLLNTQSNLKYFQQIQKNHLDPNRINEEFLQSLSEPDSLVLTDQELMYCELFSSDGDEVKAIESSGLHIGLTKNKDKSYYDSIKLRSFYLRRKLNVAEYLKSLQKQRVQVLSSGKEHLQSELLSLIEKLRNNGDPKLVPSILKALELVGRSIGAFEDRQVVEHVKGDDALDKILNQAKEAVIYTEEGHQVWEGR